MKKYKKSDSDPLLPVHLTSRENVYEFNDVFEKIQKVFKSIIAISTLGGILYGFIICFNYLQNINHLFLLPDILILPTSFITLIFFPILFLFLIFITAIFIYCGNYVIISLVKLNKEGVIDLKNSAHYFYLIQLLQLFSYLLIVFIWFFGFKISYYAQSTTVIILIAHFVLLNYILINSEKKLVAKLIFLSAIAKFFSLFFIALAALTTAIVAKNNVSQWSVLGIFILFLVLEIFSCFKFKNLILKDEILNNKLNIDIVEDIIIISAVVIIIVVGVLYRGLIDVQGQSLYVLRYIEKPQDSSWYLIHNGNTASSTINGMTNEDVAKLSETFQCEDAMKNRCSPIPDKSNALYGYMAWNLGDTKIFCPQSVDFFMEDGVENKTKAQKCLVIDGKHLQLVSASLIDKT